MLNFVYRIGSRFSLCSQPNPASWVGDFDNYLCPQVRNAGLGLAFLYMTVLGFDNITYGYCLHQCVTESVLGALVGVSAVFGVLGSITFPVMRKRIGLTKTGLTGFSCLVVALIPCVASVWMNGSPFDPEILMMTSPEPELGRNMTLADRKPECRVSSFISVGVFLAGVIAARFGLWIADLSVNQTLQEEVQGSELGTINGVQVFFRDGGSQQPKEDISIEESVLGWGRVRCSEVQLGIQFDRAL